MENDTPLLQLKDLKKYFKLNGGAMLHAVDGINLDIYEGETIGVVGESGCGKSTLGRTILRLIEPSSGEIIYRGKDITKMSQGKFRPYRQEMQIIFQDPYASIDPRKSVIEVIAEYMLIHKTYKHQADIYNRAAELMDMVGLARRYANMYPHELDGGRRQRIGIARALSLNPKFIVCDEPVSALDVSIQAQILNLLMDLQRDMGITYLFITHNMSVVRHISHNICVMYLGQLVETSETKELFRMPIHPYTRALLSAIPSTDIHHKKERIILKGELVSPINPKPGCRFAARCPYATADCGKPQKLDEILPNHFVACCRAKELNQL